MLSATERSGLQIGHPYTLLNYLKKPLDLLTLTADEQVITVPVETVLSKRSPWRLVVDRRRNPGHASTSAKHTASILWLGNYHSLYGVLSNGEVRGEFECTSTIPVVV